MRKAFAGKLFSTYPSCGYPQPAWDTKTELLSRHTLFDTSEHVARNVVRWDVFLNFKRRACVRPWCCYLMILNRNCFQYWDLITAFFVFDAHCFDGREPVLTNSLRSKRARKKICPRTIKSFMYWFRGAVSDFIFSLRSGFCGNFFDASWPVPGSRRFLHFSA